MTAPPIVVRIDVTYGLTVAVGDCLRQGDRLCEMPGMMKPCVCPVSGIVESIRFDGDNHEFVISISPAS